MFKDLQNFLNYSDKTSFHQLLQLYIKTFKYWWYPWWLIQIHKKLLSVIPWFKEGIMDHLIASHLAFMSFVFTSYFCIFTGIIGFIIGQLL